MAAKKKVLSPSEFYSSGTGSSAYGYNYTNRGRSAPWSYWDQSIFDPGYTRPGINQAYDGRFPTASPTSSEGVLGFTGQDTWRFISKEYFQSKT